MRLILAHGANVHYEGKHPSALRAAIRGIGPDQSIVKILLEHGADPNYQCGSFNMALSTALSSPARGHEVISILIQHNATVQTDDLLNAVRLSRVRALKVLLRRDGGKLFGVQATNTALEAARETEACKLRTAGMRMIVEAVEQRLIVLQEGQELGTAF